MYSGSSFIPKLVVAAAIALSAASCGSDSDGPTVAFITPADGAAIAGAVAVSMSADGIVIEEAGEIREGAGHFHVLADSGCVARGETIAKDADHVHFGAGQSEGVVVLEPGSHELCLQVGDGTHGALAITDTISVTVGVETVADFCTVVGEVETRLEAIDALPDDFAVVQLEWTNVLRLVAQLEAAMDLPDQTVRTGMEATVGFVRELGTAMVTSASVEEAEEALEPIWSAERESFDEADQWVLETCGINIAD